MYLENIIKTWRFENYFVTLQNYITMSKLSLCKLSCALACCVILVACTQETLEVKELVQSPNYSMKISPEEAIWRASVLIDKLDGTPTRLGAKRTVKNVKLLGKITPEASTTRSGGAADSLFYLINFDDEQGFALMGADRRVLPVYALSETGSLTEEDMKRDGLKIVMAGITSDAISRINWGGDSLIPTRPINPPIIVDPIDPPFWTVGPRLKGDIAHIYLKEPFCKYCKTASGEPSYTACTAVAAAAIMWYYKWPESYKDYTFDWAYPEADGFDTIAKLIHAIGFPENLDVKYYGTEGPMSADSSNIPQTFTNMGYTTPQCVDGIFNKEQKLLNILDSEPVYMNGYLLDTDNNGYSYIRAGHSWVIDGYYAYYDDMPHNDTIMFQRMYHCVWGWNGDSNGYYYIADKKAFQGIADIPDSDLPEDNHDAINVNYNVNFSYYYGMRPQK